MMAAQIFSGASVGILLGLLLGLSTSPVVALIVGALATFVSQLISSRATPGVSTEAAKPSQLRIEAYRLGTFALTCVLGVILGLYMRTHDSLSPSIGALRKEVDALVEIGVPKSESQKIVLGRYKSTKMAALDNTPKPDTGSHTILFNTQSERCEALAIDNVVNVRTVINIFQAKEEKRLVEVAKLVNAQPIDEPKKLTILKATLEAVCEKP